MTMFELQPPNIFSKEPFIPRSDFLCVYPVRVCMGVCAFTFSLFPFSSSSASDLPHYRSPPLCHIPSIPDLPVPPILLWCPNALRLLITRAIVLMLVSNLQSVSEGMRWFGVGR